MSAWERKKEIEWVRKRERESMHVRVCVCVCLQFVDWPIFYITQRPTSSLFFVSSSLAHCHLTVASFIFLSLFLRSKIAILIAILTVTFLPNAIICAHALPGCFSSRYLRYMFFATIIYSVLVFFHSLNNVNVALHFIRIDESCCVCIFYLGKHWVCVCFVCVIFFRFDFSICCFICYPWKANRQRRQSQKFAH